MKKGKKQKLQSKSICAAMREAGITNPDSQEGIDFCLHCPYSRCMVFESGRGRPRKLSVQDDMIIVRRKESVRSLSRRMHTEGKSVEEIAKELDRTVRTIYRYLE